MDFCGLNAGYFCGVFGMYNGIKNTASGLGLYSDYTIYNIEGGFRALVFAIFIFDIHILYWPSHQFLFQFNISLESCLSRSMRIALHSAGNFFAAEKHIFTSISAPTGRAFFSTLSGNTKCVPCS